MNPQQNISRKRIRRATGIALILELGLVALNVYMFQKNRSLNEKLKILTVDKTEIEQSMEAIENNLANIRSLHFSIDEAFMKGDSNAIKRVNIHVNRIQELMEANDSMVTQLTTKVEGQSGQLDAYAGDVEQLKRRVYMAKKDLNAALAEKSALEGQLALAQEKMENLEFKLGEQKMALGQQQNDLLNMQSTLRNQEEALYTAYYAVGEYRDLKDQNVVQKEGGIFGFIGAKTVAENVNLNAFNRIDIRTSRYIPVFADRAELASNHPKESYEWVEDEKDIQYLHITDPELFWEQTTYLVVVTGNGINDLFTANF